MELPLERAPHAVKRHWIIRENRRAQSVGSLWGSTQKTKWRQKHASQWGQQINPYLSTTGRNVCQHKLLEKKQVSHSTDKSSSEYNIKSFFVKGVKGSEKTHTHFQNIKQQRLVPFVSNVIWFFTWGSRSNQYAAQQLRFQLTVSEQRTTTKQLLQVTHRSKLLYFHTAASHMASHQMLSSDAVILNTT